MTWKEIRVPVYFFVGALLFAIGYHWYMTSQGYQWQWSQTNMRFIWVDKDGKP